MENQNNNFANNQSPLSSGGYNQDAPVLQKAKKAKLRWKGGITIFLFITVLVYFLSDYFGNHYLSSSHIGGFLSSEVGNFLYTIIFLGIIFFWPFLASVRMVETKIINSRDIGINKILKNLSIIAFSLILVGFLYISTFGAYLLIFGGPVFFLIIVVISFLASFLFGFIPALIFQREYRYDKLSRIEKISKVALIVGILFSLITIGHFVASQKTCGFYTVGYCLGRKAAETGNYNLCEKIKIKEGVTDLYDVDECYKHAAYVSKDASLCNNIKTDAIVDICLDGMAYRTKNINLCLGVSSVKKKNECLDSFLKDGRECGKIKDEYAKSECIINALEKEEKLIHGALDQKDSLHSSWLNLNSARDTGLKFDFDLTYPSQWRHDGSVDGGSFSLISFYETDKYSKTCEKEGNVSSCHVAGIIAAAVVSNPSAISEEVSYDNERKEDIVIDGYNGFKLSGIVKSEGKSYVGKSGQKEIRLIVPNVLGNYFSFAMIPNEQYGEEVFDNIIKTIRFPK